MAAAAAAAFPSSHFSPPSLSLSSLSHFSRFTFWAIQILSTGINGISFVHLVLISVGTWLRMGSFFRRFAFDCFGIWNLIAVLILFRISLSPSLRIEIRCAADCFGVLMIITTSFECPLMMRWHLRELCKTKLRIKKKLFYYNCIRF